MKRRLIRYLGDFGRMGTLCGLFIVDENEYAILQKLIEDQTPIYWGEVLGKHSEIEWPIEKEEIMDLDVSDTFIDNFLVFVGPSFGYNPIQRYKEYKKEED